MTLEKFLKTEKLTENVLRECCVRIPSRNVKSHLPFSHVTSRLTTHPLTPHQVTCSTSVTSPQDSQHIPSRHIKSHVPLQSHHLKTHNTSPHATSSHMFHFSHITSRLATHPLTPHLVTSSTSVTSPEDSQSNSPTFSFRISVGVFFVSKKPHYNVTVFNINGPNFQHLPTFTCSSITEAYIVLK